jgi:hypothetical protein
LGCNGGRHIGLTTLLLSCADFLKLLGASSSRSQKGLHKGLLYISVLCACSYLYIEICARNKHTNYTLLHLPTRDTSVKATDNNPSRSKTPRLEFCIHTTKLWNMARQWIVTEDNFNLEPAILWVLLYL